MQKLQTICDICGAVKHDTNHWWKVWLNQGVICIAPAEQMAAPGYAIDVCGQNDVVLYINRFMEENAERKLT